MRIIAALVMMASCLECVGNAQDSPGVHKLRQSLDHLRELGADDRLESLSPADRSVDYSGPCGDSAASWFE